ncbi:hypothetical protein L917_14824 [Phytophthora nicotianae]|uniref:RxLR effector protein n=2 Tax=Phytophthora nicotianae TaxID=4792 RepID=V9EI18_PHYNI|nr:hypothetical protein F443_15557 [Phytophthora nicotianae P1569]ETL85681.1 hypothetical protein L917_14824 [Phytophthora nicotianae]
MMILSTAAKVFALLAPLILDATCANPISSRQLRIEYSEDRFDTPPARELQGKFGWTGWLAIAKTNLRFQPTDKLFDYLRQIKEKLQRSDG